MTNSLPYDQDTPLSISELLKHSMKSVETLSSDHSLLDKMTTHLNGLLRQKQDNSPTAVFDRMFLHAEKAMSVESDKQVLSVLKRQVSSFIGVTLGVQPFLEQRETAKEDEEEEEVERLSLATAEVKEEEHKKTSKWEETKEFYHRLKADIFGPEHTEHERLRQLAEENYGEHSADEEEGEEGEDEEGESEYEEVEVKVPVKSREIGGTEEFQVVRRRQKKKKTTKTYTVTNSYRPPRHPVQTHEFHPKMLEHLSQETFCVPIFFPSEESYRVFHSALSSAKRTLHVCVFSLTDNDTAYVLGDAYERGVDVRIITDNDQMDSRKGADVTMLNERYGIPYKYDNSDQFMHNKFAVIDNKIVITGSFNWSAGARYKNRENVVITNIPSVVESYAKEFEKLWAYF